MRHCIFASVIFASIIAAASWAAAEEGTAPPPSKKLKVFILSGQSNMAGWGDSTKLPEELRKGSDRVLMFEDGKWQPLRPFVPVDDRFRDRLGMTEFSFGPEISFGQEMAKAWPTQTIGIVKHASSATPIIAWRPGGDGVEQGPVFKALVEKVQAARKAADCELMAFLWLQGEADMKDVATAKAYLGNLKDFVQAFRKELGVPDLPLLIASYRLEGMPDDLTGVDPAKFPVTLQRPGAVYVLQAHYDAQKELSPAKMVPLRNLETHPGSGHFNAAGQLTLGRLFAQSYLDLLRDGGSFRMPPH